ncbi:hypothetical protein V6N13_025718 [Hibiscus sabdariffa]|uniref:HTH myb-type domain-containing protein n=1 Tax=Hibiscus sabdariffa TaxID=183260 RepID=A0ABR2CAB5_9ROSI
MTRTPTQVASHAQKYFLRQATDEKKKRRPSLFDMPLQEDESTPSGTSSSSKENSTTQTGPMMTKVAAAHSLPTYYYHIIQPMAAAPHGQGFSVAGIGYMASFVGHPSGIASAKSVHDQQSTFVDGTEKDLLELRLGPPQ